MQPDHRIPYEIGGNPSDMMNTEYFMLLSPAANRDKSWACEHCPNWSKKDISMCKTCYYAYPEQYLHIAGKEERHLHLIFNKDEIKLYDLIIEQAQKQNLSSQDFIKRMLHYMDKIEFKNQLIILFK